MEHRFLYGFSCRDRIECHARLTHQVGVDKSVGSHYSSVTLVFQTATSAVESLAAELPPRP